MILGFFRPMKAYVVLLTFPHIIKRPARWYRFIDIGQKKIGYCHGVGARSMVSKVSTSLGLVWLQGDVQTLFASLTNEACILDINLSGRRKTALKTMRLTNIETVLNS